MVLVVHLMQMILVVQLVQGVLVVQAVLIRKQFFLSPLFSLP